MTLTHAKGLEEMEVHDVGAKLRAFLNSKAYLIILDDIWSTEAWNCLRTYFPDSYNGIRILLTSRNRDLAVYADPWSQPHDLRLLDPIESWDLFVKKVFGAGLSATACPPQLEELGRKIMGKYGRLPLAIVVLRGLLSRKERTPISWQRVFHRVNWHLSQGANSCLDILAFSYNDLPYYLKSCFLYCGLYPEDHEINRSKLMHIWVAEGFVESGEERVALEDIVEDYLAELLHRNMIQVVRRRSVGGAMIMCIHDLLRDLAVSEARKARFFYIHGHDHSTLPDLFAGLSYTILYP